jgi:hypothetical protein
MSTSNTTKKSWNTPFGEIELWNRTGESEMERLVRTDFKAKPMKLLATTNKGCDDLANLIEEEWGEDIKGRWLKWFEDNYREVI